MMDVLHILNHYLKARYLHSFRDRKALEHFQKRKFEAFRKRVLSKTDFYKPYLNSSLAEFPIMDKQSCRENFASLNTLGIQFGDAYDLAQQATVKGQGSARLDDITIGMSTGTTGNRGLFLVSSHERQRWLGTILAKALPDSILKPQRIALMLAANSDLYNTARQNPHFQIRFYDLSEGLDCHLPQLEAFAPTILIGTAQALTYLATARAQHEITFTPRKIISGGEVLDPQDQQLIEQAFGLHVDQIYQCTEGFFGVSCEHGSIHLAEDCVLFEKEWIDENKRKFVPLVTDFSRDTQALVRYRMNDILTERLEPCPCGSPLTAICRIEGRSDDCFLIPNFSGMQMTTILPDVIRNTVIDCSSTINDFRVHQLTPQLIEIQLPANSPDEIEQLVMDKLGQLIEGLGCLKPEFKLTRGIEASAAHKLRRVKRCFKEGEVI